MRRCRRTHVDRHTHARDTRTHRVSRSQRLTAGGVQRGAEAATAAEQSAVRRQSRSAIAARDMHGPSVALNDIVELILGDYGEEERYSSIDSCWCAHHKMSSCRRAQADCVAAAAAFPDRATSRFGCPAAIAAAIRPPDSRRRT